MNVLLQISFSFSAEIAFPHNIKFANMYRRASFARKNELK